jgi:glycosyltransferase involved in cell wall biosynthesis
VICKIKKYVYGLSKQKNIIISDFFNMKGGAGVVAAAELTDVFKCSEAKRISFDGNYRTLLFKNLLLLWYILGNTKYIVHTWSYFPILAVLVWIKPAAFTFVVHDYILVCPNRSYYDFKDQSVCKLRGYSIECRNTDCGYSKSKKRINTLIGFLTRPQLHKLRFRFLSKLSKNTFRESVSDLKNYSIVPNVDCYKDHFDENQLKVERSRLFSLNGLDEKINYILYIGRASEDKGYDRFLDLDVDAVKIACGPTYSKSLSVTALGWLKNIEIEALVSKCSAICYPSRQLDCDPLVFQLSKKYSVPIYVSAGNAIADDVKNIYGPNYVIDNWSSPLTISQNPCCSKFGFQGDIGSSTEKLREFYGFSCD